MQTPRVSQTLSLSFSKCRQYHLKFQNHLQGVEGVFELDSEHEGLEPEAQNSDPSLGSESSVGNLDDL